MDQLTTIWLWVLEVYCCRGCVKVDGRSWNSHFSAHDKKLLALKVTSNWCCRCGDWKESQTMDSQSVIHLAQTHRKNKSHLSSFYFVLLKPFWSVLCVFQNFSPPPPPKKLDHQFVCPPNSIILAFWLKKQPSSFSFFFVNFSSQTQPNQSTFFSLLIYRNIASLFAVVPTFLVWSAYKLF